MYTVPVHVYIIFSLNLSMSFTCSFHTSVKIVTVAVTGVFLLTNTKVPVPGADLSFSWKYILRDTTSLSLRRKPTPILFVW